MATTKKKPQTIDDIAPDAALTADEEEALEEPQTAGQRLAAAANPKSAIVEGAPSWALVPPDLIIPRGVEVAFMKIQGRLKEWIIVIWELSVRDEKLARARCLGDTSRAVEESAKQMVRALNGEMVTGANPIMIEEFWEDIGAKYRTLLNTWFLKAHSLEQEERLSFFSNCVVARRTV